MAGKVLSGRPAAAVLLFIASFTIVCPMIFAATTHTVGDSTGWTIPPNKGFYSSWSSSKKFNIGDTLQFNFPTGAHTVVEVPKSSYDACSTKQQIGATVTTGPAAIKIDSAGDHYYICTIPGHCSLNQKLSITVSGGSSSSPPPTDSPSPVPSPTAGGPSTGGDSAAPPTSTVGIAAAAAGAILLAVALV